MPATRVLEDRASLAGLTARWDELAALSNRPYCSPGWMLAWWDNVAPEGSRLRVVVVEAEGVAVGIAPLFVEKGPGGLDTYRFLGRETSMRLEPLVDPSATGAWEALIEGLGLLGPPVDVLTLEGVEPGTAWVQSVSSSLGSPWTHRDTVMPAPYVELDPEGHDAWLGRKSSNFRQQMRRSRRALEADGATFRRSTPDTSARDLDTFARLHLERWEGRGGSVAIRPGVVPMLKQVAETEVASGRMRIFNVDLGDETISTQIFMCAGDEYGYWLGGFDEAHSSGRPGLLAILAGVEDAHNDGFRRVDLGPGDDEYKYRLTDKQEDLAWLTLVARGGGFVGRRARLAPHLARVALRNRLSDDMKAKINKLLRRS